MWKLCVVAVAFFALGCMADDKDMHSVRSYNKDKFLEQIPKKNHLVMFYAPWCGYSKRLFPVWEKVAQKYNSEIPNAVTIAKVDCDEQSSLCHQQGVHSYPHVKLFKVGSDKAIEFHGERNFETLHKFVESHLK